MRPQFVRLFALTLSIWSSLQVDCTTLDPSLGTVQPSSEDDLISVGFTYGVDVEILSQAEVLCTYLSFKGFQLWYFYDLENQIYVNEYVGEVIDDVNDDGILEYRCKFQSS